MGDGVADKRENVVIGDPVDDAFALTLALDQSGGMQDLQTRRNGGDLLLLGGGDFLDAEALVGEQHQGPQSRNVRQGVEHACRFFQVAAAGRFAHGCPCC